MEFCKEVKVLGISDGDGMWVRLSETMDRRSITLSLVETDGSLSCEVTLTPGQFRALCEARYVLDVKTEDPAPEVKP